MADQVIGYQYGLSTQQSYDQENLRVSTTQTRSHLVLMDSDTATEDEVAAVSGVLPIGTESTEWGGAYVFDRSITEVAPRVWEVEYTLQDSFSRRPEDETDPTNLEPEWSWSTETQEEVLWEDAQDQSAIWNSAREPLGFITAPFAIPVLTIRRLEAAFSPDTILNYMNRVNDASFWGASAGKALMAAITADPEVIDGLKLWRVQYVIKFNMKSYGWKARLLDHGKYYWSGTVGASDKVPFGDDALNPVLGNLNGSGGQNTTSTPQYVDYNRFDAADFSALNLGPFT